MGNIMRLTKWMKEQFVKDVMAKLPKVDYTEQAHALVKKEAIEQLPPAIRAIYDDVNLRDFLCTIYVRLPRYIDDINVYNSRYEVSENTRKQLEELADKKRDQTEKRNVYQTHLQAIIDGCTNLKQAHERLPDFVDFLPTENSAPPIPNLPATKALAEQLRAEGWPA